MKTFNRIYTVAARLKLKRKSYYRRVSFIALMSMMLVSFQNCSQGKFETDAAQNASASKANSSGSGGNTASADPSVPVPPPPPIPDPVPVPDPTPTGPTQAQINAEFARKTRCASAIKMPVITNTADFSNKIVSVKSGLATDAGDLNVSNNPSRPIVVNIEASQGIDSSKYLVSDACDFKVEVVEEMSSDSGKLPTFTNGIDNNGDLVVVSSTAGQTEAERMAAVLKRNTSGNNQTGLTYTVGTPSMGINYQIRQTTTNDTRTIRCAEGSVYYKYKVRAQTQNLNSDKAPFTAGTAVPDVVMETGYVFAKVEVTNNCWKETNLTKLTGSSAPAVNSQLGTAVSADGEWAVSISPREGATNNGYIYIFRKVTGAWTFFQKLKAPNGSGTALTGAVVKSNVLVVASSGDGQYRANPPRSGYPGQVYVYNLDGNALTTPVQTIGNPLALGTKFGSSIAITPVGIAIGDAYSAGKAYLFKNYSGVYGEGGSHTYSSVFDATSIGNAALLGFGNSMVCQSGKLAIGAYDGNAGYAGSVHIFDAAAGSFSTPINLSTPTAMTSAAQFGFSISISGNSAVVGAYENATNGNTSGAIVYYQDYTTATAPYIIQGAAAEDRLGVSVAFNGGDSVYVGSRGGTGSSGTVSRYLISDLVAKKDINSKIFTQRTQTAVNGEGFSYAMGVLSGQTVPTLIVSAQTKEYLAGAGDLRSKAGGVYIYEVK